MEPDELRYKEFKRSVRGYSPDEVDDLIDSVANELDELRTEQARLSREFDESQRKVEEYESLEGSLRATLVQAEKAATEYQEAARQEAEATLEEARREAENTVQEAEKDARRMLADASSKVERVQDSYEALRETRDGLDSELRRLLEGYLRQLDEANSAIASELETPLRERLDTEAISAAHAAAEEERLEQTGEESGSVDRENQENREYAQETDEQESDDGPTSGETVETAELAEPRENAEEPGSHGVEPSGNGAENLGLGRFLRRRG